MKLVRVAETGRYVERPFLAMNRHPAARNRLLLYPQNRTFRSPCWTSVRDPFQTLLTLPEKLIKIGAKVVRHGRYVTFQLAEVAVSRALRTQILGLIADLRAPPPKPA